MQLVEFDPLFVEGEATPESYKIGNKLMAAAITGLGKDIKSAKKTSCSNQAQLGREKLTLPHPLAARRIVDHLEGHLKAAGLVDTNVRPPRPQGVPLARLETSLILILRITFSQTLRVPSPYGPSIPSALPADYRALRHSTLLGAHAVVFYRLTDRRPDLLPDEIKTEAAFEAWMTQFEKDLDEVGGSQDWGIAVGRKPDTA